MNQVVEVNQVIKLGKVIINNFWTFKNRMKTVMNIVQNKIINKFLIKM